MSKRVFAATALAVLAGACAPQSSDPSAELTDVADAYLATTLAANPFIPYFGLSDVFAADHAAIPDLSRDAQAAFDATEDALYDRLAAIDATRLESRGEWVTYHSLKEVMEANQGLRQCNQALWSISHMTGWQSFLSIVAQQQPTDSEEERAAAVERWSNVPVMINQDIANLREGLASGYSAPRSVVEVVIGQIGALADAPFETSPLMAFVAGADDADFAGAMREVFDRDLAPALAAYRDFLRDDYLAAAREEIAISVLPGGAQCYEAMLRSYHSADIGAQRTYDRGREAVEANKAGVIARGRALLGEDDFETILARVKEEPANRFSSEQELIDYTRALVPETREKVAPFFSELPAQEMIVEPYPDYLKGTGQSSRYEQKPPGEAAIYRINTDDWAEDTRGGADIVAVHEGWPGHHLQIATARAINGLHLVTRLTGSTAYIEGWARYSEALAEEAGVYVSGYGEITRRAWPARGMVVDPGVHVFGWSNDEAIAFLMESGRFTEETARTRLNRIAVIPGQLTAYDTGGLEIFALRREAEARLGEDFDIAAFHDRILENGAVPLGALREHVQAWIADAETDAAN